MVTHIYYDWEDMGTDLGAALFLVYLGVMLNQYLRRLRYMAAFVTYVKGLYLKENEEWEKYRQIYEDCGVDKEGG